ncbi:MAG TPA: nuclear transport factor 2 family protein [Steroidobacteraceae bacterium]|jgi:uncharacterized protein (TIGR02246 family)
MKSVAAICLFGVLALAGTAWAQAQQGDDTSEKAVAALENQWLESQKTNNPDLVAPLLADKFVSTSAEGKLQSKAEMLAATRKRKYTSVEYNDVHVTAFGNTAIATGVYKGKGTDTGKPFDETERWTDTWVKMPGGKWLCVADHNTTVSK